MNETKIAKKLNSFFCWLCVKGIRKQFCIVCDYTLEHINRLTAAMNAGGAAEQFEMGLCYYLGDGVDQDYDAAFLWFSKAAEQNYAKAQLYLGECYDSGYGVEQDRKQAGRLFLKAAQQGLAEAQFRVTSCFMGTFNGFEYNPEQYKYWKDKAAEQGYGSKEYQRDCDKERAIENAARWRRNEKELKRLNLNTIEDLENLLKPIVKHATKLIIKRQETEPQDSYLRSHFRGQPYFEKGEKWPSLKEGDQFDFIFQIFNTGDINLPFNIKLLQFYYDYENSPISYRTYTDDYVCLGYKYGNGWLVKAYEKLDIANSFTMDKPDWCCTDLYCEFECKAIKSLPCWKYSNECNETVEMFCEKLDGESKDKNFDSYNFVAEKLGCEQDFITKLGGYPNWLQGDGSPKNKDFQLLFQLDSEDEAGLHWVDVGLVYVFYNPKTKKFIFEIQYC
ncbi:MAG: DUF1963 domain-containing protein [Treponema sp.]|jgi:uncharacterized protein YwqG|nr:DUF1963 domain-containing protein [Treponema sp.]